MKLISSTCLALFVAGGLLSLNPVPDDREQSAEDKAVIAAELPNYPLTTCVVSKRPLDVGDGPFNIVVGGHLFRVCCPGCEATARPTADGAAATGRAHEMAGEIVTESDT